MKRKREDEDELSPEVKENPPTAEEYFRRGIRLYEIGDGEGALGSFRAAAAPSENKVIQVAAYNVVGLFRFYGVGGSQDYELARRNFFFGDAVAETHGVDSGAVKTNLNALLEGRLQDIQTIESAMQLRRAIAVENVERLVSRLNISNEKGSN